MEVQLIVDTESIPRDSSYFPDVPPPENKSAGKSETKSIDQTQNKSTDGTQVKSTGQAESKSTGQKSKTSTTIGVVLYYQTEDAYYVRIKKEQNPVGPILSFSSHSVEGLVFTK
ncbi:MAG TPA: hypothetical protein VE263_22760 [Candidatus Angelobacter sp.]|nr:hypothetical protein [Candidatus Angelobacter sp.]